MPPSPPSALGCLRKATKPLGPKQEPASELKVERSPSLRGRSIFARISSTVVPGKRSGLAATGTGFTLKGAAPLRAPDGPPAGGVTGAGEPSSLPLGGVLASGGESPFPLEVSAGGLLRLKDRRLWVVLLPLYGLGPASRLIFSAEGKSRRGARDPGDGGGAQGLAGIVGLGSVRGLGLTGGFRTASPVSGLPTSCPAPVPMPPLAVGQRGGGHRGCGWEAMVAPGLRLDEFGAHVSPSPAAAASRRAGRVEP